MILVFYLTFSVIGAWLQGLLEIGIDKVSALVEAALTAANVNSAMHSLVTVSYTHLDVYKRQVYPFSY